MRVGSILSFFWGFIPENPRKKNGEILGAGIAYILGILGGFTQKHPNFRGFPEDPRSDEYQVLFQGPR